MFYTPGHKFFASYKAEADNLSTLDTTAAATGAEPILSTAPTSGYTLIGQINPLDIVKDNGARKGFGAGAQRAAYNKTVGRTYDATIPVRIAPAYGVDFINRCLLTTPGTGAANGLPESVLAFGTSTAVEIFRYSVCNQLTADFREGADSELSVSAQMMGVYEDAATLSSVPTLDNIRDIGAPFNWHNIVGFTIDGVDYRKYIAGISFTVNHNVERKGFRDLMSGSGLKASRCVYELLPHHAVCSGELTLHKELLKTSNDWGDIEIVIDDEVVLTLTDAVPQSRRQPGVESSAQLGWTVPFDFDYLTAVEV